MKLELATTSVQLQDAFHQFGFIDFDAALDFLPLNLSGGAPPFTSSDSCEMCTSSFNSHGKVGGFPNCWISRTSLSAEALMGMPVQWKAKGKSTLAPLSL